MHMLKPQDTMLPTSFFRRSAHDLRSPMTALLGYAQMAQKKGSAQDPVVTRLAQEAIQFSDMVEIFLQATLLFGKINFDFREYQLAEIVIAATKRFQLYNPKKNIVENDQLKDYPCIADKAKLQLAIEAIVMLTVDVWKDEQRFSWEAYSTPSYYRFAFFPTDCPFRLADANDQEHGEESYLLHYASQCFYRHKGNVFTLTYKEKSLWVLQLPRIVSDA